MIYNVETGYFDLMGGALFLGVGGQAISIDPDGGSVDCPYTSARNCLRSIDLRSRRSWFSFPTVPFSSCRGLAEDTVTANATRKNKSRRVQARVEFRLLLTIKGAPMMSLKPLVWIAASALVMTLGMRNAVAGECFDQPNMAKALHSLEKAKEDLQRAEHNKGGWREAAIRHVEESLVEVRRGCAFENERRR
jgi:hypothetical protein